MTMQSTYTSINLFAIENSLAFSGYVAAIVLNRASR